ncbi:hypothetical protein [Rhodococcus rhodochrous]|uniref:hypothetical protein n=1 Tax=Rhodococcus rhodochrous TaxID=1829 RepID=UPI000AB46643|nr:hypothetical protein [Rhodococcus rhodochrous]
MNIHLGYKARASVAAALATCTIALGSSSVVAAEPVIPQNPVVHPVFLGTTNPSCGPLVSLPLIGPILNIVCRV